MRKLDSEPKAKPLIAYDLETTMIKAGNPVPLYITAHGENFAVSVPICGGVADLALVLETHFLLENLNGARFIAWNGNKFDAYLIGAALLHSDRYIIRPYLTRGKTLRGMRVEKRGGMKTKKGKIKRCAWEFLDGIAMTGIIKPLKDFLKTFAPGMQKLDAPDFEKGESFDARNLAHVEYAERDSEGLYAGILAAQRIVMDKFGVPLQPTIGNTGIKIFMREMPWNVACWSPPLEVLHLIRRVVMRGGYCHCVKRYRGPIWKYDLNQAYAAAMRSTWLPAGTCYHKPKASYSPMLMCAIYRVSGMHPRNIVPFYYTAIEDGVRRFGVREIADTWLTSIEVQQLMSEGWKLNVADCYYWDSQFTMKGYVDKLESLRINAPDGPNGAEGTMIKYIGCNSYGKTVEVLGGVELVMSRECPEGFYEYQAEDEAMHHIWFRFGTKHAREYHQPQIGAFVTAYVRMEVRRAALTAPAAFLYADTDCVVFNRPVALPIDPKRYGFWKQECDGDAAMLIGKKIYTLLDGTSKAAKGVNPGRLTLADFENWFNGVPPVQVQVQRQNFVKVMTGTDMFITMERSGTGNAALAA